MAKIPPKGKDGRDANGARKAGRAPRSPTGGRSVTEIRRDHNVERGRSLLRDPRPSQDTIDNERAWADTLPDPADDRPPPRGKEYWLKFYLDRGYPGEEATAMAVKATDAFDGTADDMIRDLWTEQGANPERVEARVTEARRRRKWNAVVDATRNEEINHEDRETEAKLRPFVDEALTLTARLVKDSYQLTKLIRDIATANAKLLRNRRILGPEWITFADVLSGIPELSGGPVKEMTTLRREIARPAGGQRDDIVRRAAKALKDLGLSHQQIADVLTRRELRRAVSAENVRDLLRKSASRKSARRRDKLSFSK